MFGNPSDEGIFLLVDGTRPMSGHLTLADLPDALTSGDYPIQMMSGISDGATAQGYVFDTVNTLTATGARLFDFKINGADRFHYEANGTFEFAHIPSGSLYIQDYTPDPFTALGVDTTSTVVGFGEAPIAFELVARVQGAGFLPTPTGMRLEARVESHGGLAQARGLDIIALQASNTDLSGMWGIIMTLGTESGTTAEAGLVIGMQIDSAWSGAESGSSIAGIFIEDLGAGAGSSLDSVIDGITIGSQIRGAERSAINIKGVSHGGDILLGTRSVTNLSSMHWNGYDLQLNASLSSVDGRIATLSHLSVANTNAPALGAETVVNGDFSAGSTGWTVTTGWDLTGGNANHNITGNDPLSQVLSGLTIGVTYALTYTVTGNSDASSGEDSVASAIDGAERTVHQKPGTYTDYFTAASATPTLAFIPQRGTATFIVDDVSVKEVLEGDIYAAGNIEARNTVAGFITPHAGTAAAGTAPIKLTDGVLLSTAEDGAIEYDDGHLFFTNNASRKTVSLAGGVDTVAALVTDTTTEITVYSETLAAGELHTDEVLRLHLYGIYSQLSGASDILTVRVKLAGTTLHTYITAVGAKSAVGIRLDYMLGVLVTGASGTLTDFLTTFDDTSLLSSSESGTHAVDTTISNALSVTVQWGAASVSNNYRANVGFIEFLH